MEDQKMIINRNIRSDYIALDKDWRAKIAEFGISIFLPPNQDDDALYLDKKLGRPSYMDPEYAMTGKLKRESDVYSFGVVLFEILCGSRANDPAYRKGSGKGLAHMARECFRKGKLNEIIDPRIKDQTGENNFILNIDSLETISNIAYQCLALTQDLRPTMKVVVKELEKALTFQEKNLEHLKIPLSDIKFATDNFSNKHRIWSSKYFILYKAELEVFDKENPGVVAVKTKGELPERHTTVGIRRILPEYKLGEKSFMRNIEMLTTYKHRNIVTLLGYCAEASEMILVFEHASNGHLSDFLINKKDMPILSWATRLKICLDVANGINYLHCGMEDQKMIINRNIRSDYIALDKDWRAKIAEFGISIFLPPNQDDDALYLDKKLGRPSYKDPEYAMTGKLKRESDVYSFGVVLFEILCGSRANDPAYRKGSGKGLAHMARECFQKGKLNEIIDPRIKDQTGENNFILNIDSLETFSNIAYQCLALTQDLRPTMKVVIKELEKALTFQTSEEHRLVENDLGLFDVGEGKVVEARKRRTTESSSSSQSNIANSSGVVTSMLVDEFSIANCMSTLEAIPDVSTRSYNKAMAYFLDLNWRKMFLMMSEHRRKKWLDTLDE